MERWVPLLGYPGYSVSSQGRIRNDKRESLLTVSRLPSNHAIVGLQLEGRQVKRSVARLVAETFLDEPRNPLFNIPIHFDGDLYNCTADNLDWRPRWFAQAHVKQFRISLPEYPDPIRELKSGEIFENCWKAVFRYGLLYTDLLKSIRFKTYVFPTMQSYEWA